jgi:hypothetical protein
MRTHQSLSARSIFICAAVGFAAFAADARTGAMAGWCALYRTGGTNCYFTSHAQCLAAVSGIGGFCNMEPTTATAERTPARRERPARTQKEVVVAVDQAPAYGGGLSIGIGGGFGGGGGHRHHGSHGGGKDDFNSKLTGSRVGLPPGLQ